MKKLFLNILSIFLILFPGVVYSDIINGGFETGDFTGWQTIGNAQIVDSSYGTDPYSGEYQAVISTGIGDVSYYDMMTFLGIDPEIQSIGLSVDPNYFLSARGSAIKTSTPVFLGEWESETKFLTNGDPNSNANHSGIPPLGYSYGGMINLAGRYGMGLIGATPYPMMTLIPSSTPYALESANWGGPGGGDGIGNFYYLAFFVVDMGPVYEGHSVLIDNVSISTSPIPEPTTALLFGLGAAGFAGVARRRKK